MYSQTKKDNQSPNKIKSIRSLIRWGVISAAVLSILFYIFKAWIYQSTDSMEFEAEIIDYAIERYHKAIKFIVPEELKGQKDWHDYAARKPDYKRKGFGEKGKPAFPKPGYISRGKNGLLKYGVSTVVSDMISCNRSVPDTRRRGCQKKLYLSELPSVSIIIVCKREYPSILKRTLHSIVNRSPRELLIEIIIVHLYEDQKFWRKFKKYADTNFKGIVNIVYLNRSQNEVLARLEGAKLAKADVLVFLSPFIECNYNWLPPLLEPIAFNKKIVTLPVSDFISAENFAYKPGALENHRVGFDFDFNLIAFQLTYYELLTFPYNNILISDQLFAIEREFFWSLGGFDEGLNSFIEEIYGFSFKTWMCGGRILTVPCSHIGQIDVQLETNFYIRDENKKRIAEIWMDDNKKYLFASLPELYETIDPGDLTLQRKLREELHCRPFEWFLNAIAPDMLQMSDPMYQEDLAWGMLRLVLYPNLCVDSKEYEDNRFVGLSLCIEKDLEFDHNPNWRLNWRLNWRGNIQLMHKNLCLEVFEPPPNSTVYLVDCHNTQSWTYDYRQQYLIHRTYQDACMDVIQTDTNWKVVLNECDAAFAGMNLAFDNVNEEAILSFWDDFL